MPMCDTAHGPEYEISVNITYAMLARGLNFGLSLHLHPCLIYPSRKSSGESAYIHRFALALVAACRCDEY